MKCTVGNSLTEFWVKKEVPTKFIFKTKGNCNNLDIAMGT
jgi:hypothetical protein